MKVLHIVLGLQIGGLERFVLDLAEAYGSRVDSVILCLADPAADPAVDSRLPAIRWDKGAGLELSLVPRIVRLAKALDVDLIHTHNPAPHFYGALAGALAGIPVIHTKHGRNYPDSWRKVWLNRIASRFTRRVVAVSRDAEAVCVEVEKIPAEKVCTILNGVDTERFRPDGVSEENLRQALPIGEETLLLGIVARLSPEKNHDLLLHACSLLKHGGRDFALAVIGDGPLRERLAARVQQLGLAEQVHFLGARADVAELVPELDVFLLSSTTEGVSLTLLEAMSCEVPVVATAVGGNPEVVREGETGFIVPLDAQAMATAVERLADSPALRRQLGAAGRQRVLREFSLQRAADAYFTLYRQALGLEGMVNPEAEQEC